ncbi:YesL family protein [Halobacillus amylolyticus]|uniref:DUF624 domain-containing protein n=1 Tax=Halobacillus amylolyticus TaxID=2932259 RepID=A0ABY4H9F9_9BACI|nr:DUF624 domain-containing protein [Halobacillus amylolyticus]UOR11437.1 DUF624 domain-containing protein [Halobacillus amylolyticus]
MNLFGSQLYRIMEWVTRFAFLQVLWIVFTIAGLGIFGIFPSTIAVFSIIRNWILGKDHTPLFKSFIHYYKTEFWKSNLLGAFVLIIVSLISIDIYYVQLSSIFTWTYIPLFSFMLISVLFIFYTFPVFVHYDLTILQTLKNSFLIMLISPIQSLLIIISLISLFIIMRYLPALGFIFGISSYSFVTMWLSLHAFRNVSKMQAPSASNDS